MSHGSTSDSSSSTARSSRQVEEDAAEGESSCHRRKRNVNEVLQGSVRQECEPEAPPAASSDDDPNEALSRLNPVQSDDEDAAEAEDEEEAGADEEDAGTESWPDETPVTREEMTSLLELQEATATGVFCTSAFCGPSGPVDDEQRLSPLQQICEQARDHLFIRRPNKHLTFYPSSAAKIWGICAVVDNLPVDYASLALVADKARWVDFNRSLSDWKTGAAERVRDISLPKLGLFRDERDAKCP
ncbi:unnamed protein product [Closterium sp. NIES-53]